MNQFEFSKKAANLNEPPHKEKNRLDKKISSYEAEDPAKAANENSVPDKKATPGLRVVHEKSTPIHRECDEQEIFNFTEVISDMFKEDGVWVRQISYSGDPKRYLVFEGKNGRLDHSGLLEAAKKIRTLSLADRFIASVVAHPEFGMSILVQPNKESKSH